MSKVIFLDIDGVLNSNFWNDTHHKEISDGTLIDVEKVKLLGQLVNNTNAKIVLHSGWKYWFNSDLQPLREEAENLRSLLAKEGMMIAGITPDHSTEEIRKSKKFSLIKAGEILVWLGEHRDVDKWIVIDDLDLKNDVGIEMASVIPNFHGKYDICDLVSCIAPRRLLIVSAEDDKYSKDASYIIEKASDTYSELNALQNLHHQRYPGGHALTKERFDFIVEWIASNVKH